MTELSDNFLCTDRYTMSKSTAIIFILGFALVLKLEEKVKFTNVHILIIYLRQLYKINYFRVLIQLCKYIVLNICSTGL